MNKPQLKLVESGPNMPLPPHLPGIETVSAFISKGANSSTRLLMSFSEAWRDLVPVRAAVKGDLNSVLHLHRYEGGPGATRGVYTRQQAEASGRLYLQLHSRYIGRDLQPGDNVPLLEVGLSSLGLSVRAVPRDGLGPGLTHRASPATGYRIAREQGSLPLDVPPAGNLIEQLRIALGNVNAIAADIPGLTLRIEDGRVRAGFDL